MNRLALVLLASVVLLGAPASATLSGNGLIAYVGPEGIYFINAAGTGQRFVGRGYAPRWSPDGTKLAYLRSESGDSLWVSGASGANARRLALSAALHSWSPDGTRIAFLDAGAVQVVDVSSGRLTRLASDDGVGSRPSWAPDGTRVALGAPTPPNSTGPIVIANADGSGTTRLPLSDAVNPVWSPDGTRIAFVKWRNVDRSLGRGELYAIRPDGSGLIRLSEELIFPAAAPVWSPDGARLLLTAARDVGYSPPPPIGQYYPARSGTYIVAADGSEQRWLSLREEESSAAWSPDGTKVVFTWRRDLSRKLFVANADGSCPKQLTERMRVDPSDPAWQPVSGRPPSEPITCTDLDLRVTSRSGSILPLRSAYGLILVIENISNEATPSARVVIRIGNQLRATSILPIGAPNCPLTGRRVVCDLGRIEAGRSRELVLQGQAVRPGRTALDISVVGRVVESDGRSDALRLLHTISRCTLIGSHRADLLDGTARRDVICGRSGRDRILGRGGNDRLLGGSNNDTLVGGRGRDFLSGGADSDVLIVDDGVHDVVWCGSGVDRVIADRRDRVARDCERVLRR